MSKTTRTKPAAPAGPTEAQIAQARDQQRAAASKITAMLMELQDEVANWKNRCIELRQMVIGRDETIQELQAEIAKLKA